MFIPRAFEGSPRYTSCCQRAPSEEILEFLFVATARHNK